MRQLAAAADAKWASKPSLLDPPALQQSQPALMPTPTSATFSELQNSGPDASHSAIASGTAIHGQTDQDHGTGEPGGRPADEDQGRMKKKAAGENW